VIRCASTISNRQTPSRRRHPKNGSRRPRRSGVVTAGVPRRPEPQPRRVGPCNSDAPPARFGLRSACRRSLRCAVCHSSTPGPPRGRPLPMQADHLSSTPAPAAAAVREPVARRGAVRSWAADHVAGIDDLRGFCGRRAASVFGAPKPCGFGTPRYIFEDGRKCREPRPGSPSARLGRANRSRPGPTSPEHGQGRVLGFRIE
jgi:hypothetical protein